MLLVALVCAVSTTAQTPHDSSQGGMAGMDMSGDMKDMGPSMAAMAGHMYVTALRARQPGDEEKVRAIVAQVRAAIERYRDYKKALADGYVIANPKVDEPQFHFNNQANIQEEAHRFDPTRP
jgi:cytochrome c556